MEAPFEVEVVVADAADVGTGCSGTEVAVADTAEVVVDMLEVATEDAVRLAMEVLDGSNSVAAVAAAEAQVSSTSSLVIPNSPRPEKLETPGFAHTVTVAFGS